MSIGGDLNIEENEAIYSFDGLNNLVQITGSLKIKENLSLESLSGLNNLITIDEDLIIGGGYSWTGNPQLSDLSGLSSLSTVGNTLRVVWNHGLIDLSGIETLTNIENIYISSNDNLSSLDGLQGISNVNGYITISGNESLNSLYGLNNLSTAGNLSLYRLVNLDSINALDRLNYVSNDLTIESNHTITNINSLDSLNYIGGKLSIDNNYDLINLSGLENLTEIGGGLEIHGNHSLLSIDALSSVIFIGGDLIIRGSSNLNSLSGLSGVTAIDGDLEISGFVNLTSLMGIENINPVSIENLTIAWLVSLTDCAFPNICDYLQDPNGVVDIYRNGESCNSPAQIANECGFTMPCLPYGNYHFMYQHEIDSFQSDYPGCTDLEGSLLIHGGWGGGMGDYTNLSGLSVVTSIDSILLISHAYYLTSLSGLENIVGTSISDLYIVGSPFLSECGVQSICDYLVNPSGLVEIEDNDYGCNSPEEVLDACESVLIQEKVLKENFKIFPNPANDYILIKNLSNQKIDNVVIFNNIGQAVYSKNLQGSIINISNLSQGLYIIEINAGNNKERFKLMLTK